MLSVERAPQALAFSSRNNKAGPVDEAQDFAESSSPPLFRYSLDSSPQSDMASWPSASQQASPVPEGLDHVAPETPSLETPQGDVAGSFPESYDPLALPGWNLGEDETWTSLLGDLGGPVLEEDPLGSGYMDLGPETPSPQLAAPSVGGPWEAPLQAPTLAPEPDESCRPYGRAVKAELGSNSLPAGIEGGIAEAQGGFRPGPVLADHVRQLVLRGSGYSLASRGEKARSLEERLAFPTSHSRTSQGSGRSQSARPLVPVRSSEGGGPPLVPLQEPSKVYGGGAEKSEGVQVEAEWSISELRGMLGLDAGEGEGEAEDALAALPQKPLAVYPLHSEQQTLGGSLYAPRTLSGSGSGSGSGSQSQRSSGSPPGSSRSGSLRSGGGVSRESSESRERGRVPLSREGSGSLAGDSFHSARSGGSGEGSVRGGVPGALPRAGEALLAGTKRGLSESADGEEGFMGELDLGMDLDGPSGSDSMVGGHGSGSLSCDGCSSGLAHSPSSFGHSIGAGEEADGEGEGVEALPRIKGETGDAGCGREQAGVAGLPPGATATGSSLWHNKTAMLLLQGTNTHCDGASPGSSGQGCRCGRCHGGATGFRAGPSGQEGEGQQPGVLSSRRPQGSREQAQEGRATAFKPQVLAAQAVNERSRPGDLSGRLAAVLGQLSHAPGLPEQPQAPGADASTGSEQGEEGAQAETLHRQEEEASRLPAGNSLMQFTGRESQGGVGIGMGTHALGRARSSSSSPSSASRRAQAGSPSLGAGAPGQVQAGAAATSTAAAAAAAAEKKKAAGGVARGLKRDARRKKGKFSTEPQAEGGAAAGTLGATAGGGALVVASGRRGGSPVGGYFRTCDVDAAWHVTPGPLPSPALPALTASGEFQLGPGGWFGWRSPRDFAFSPSPYTFGATLDLGARSHGAGTPRGGLAGNLMGPGLLPGREGEGVGESGWGGGEAKRPLRDQLMLLAEAYAVDDAAKVRSLTRKLEKKADRFGAPDQRLALYFLQALEARAEGTASARYVAPITIPAVELNAAMQELCKRVPFLQTSQLATHETILAATAGSDSVHILALGLWHGDNWGELFARMAKRPGGGPAKLRISGVDAPCTPGKLAIKVSTANAVLQVKAAAAQAGIQAQVEFIQTPIDQLRASSVVVHPGETLVAFCCMRLQHLPDGSVVRANPRDSLLQMIFDLKPKCFVMTDIDANFNSPFFLARVKEALNYFGTVFDSVDASSERTCPRRQIFEEAYFARDILNVVACEGLQRMSRSERIEQWGDRLRRLGFASAPFPPTLFDKLRMLYACRARASSSGPLPRTGSAGAEAFPGSEEEQFRVVEVPDGLEVGWGRGRLLFGSCWTTTPTDTATAEMQA